MASVGAAESNEHEEDLRAICAESLLRISPRLCRLLTRRILPDHRSEDTLTATQLLFLERLHRGAATASSLARDTLVHPATATQITDVLVARGLVTRGRRPEDRRLVMVSLTAHGQEVRDRAHAFAISQFTEDFSQLSHDEVKLLFAALLSLETLLERVEPSGATMSPSGE